MKYKEDIVFWSDISFVALEAIMSHSSDVNNVEYLRVRSVSNDVINFMQKNGLSKDFLEASLTVFNEVRRIFVNTELAKSTSPHLVPATLVAICIKHNIEDEIDDDTFNDLIVESFSYLSNYQFKYS